jgi:hypothetical protein
MAVRGMTVDWMSPMASWRLRSVAEPSDANVLVASAVAVSADSEADETASVADEPLESVAASVSKDVEEVSTALDVAAAVAESPGTAVQAATTLEERPFEDVPLLPVEPSPVMPPVAPVAAIRD